MRTSERTTGRRRRLPVSGALAAVLALSVCVAAGCGSGSGGPQVASVATTSPATPSTTGNDGAKPAASTQTYSACMRSHGVPKFPDANADGGIAIDSSSGINPDSAQFKTAEQACQKLAPTGTAPSPAQQAKNRDQELEFSACMRSHGLPNFPDPVFSSGGRTQMRIDAKSGLDPNSPIFQAAQRTCQKLLPDHGPGGRLQRAGGPAPTGGSSRATAGP
jgi:hypothetical protein